jgi:hypothetical protein
MCAAVVSLVAIELLTGMGAAASSTSARVDPALLVPQMVAVGVAGEVGKRPKVAELYQALCRVWGGVEE